MSTAWPTEAATKTCSRQNIPHGAHEWGNGNECRGITQLESLTLPQIEAVANALGLDPGRLFVSVVEAMEAQR